MKTTEWRDVKEMSREELEVEVLELRKATESYMKLAQDPFSMFEGIIPDEYKKRS